VPENVASRDYLVGVRTDAFGSVYQAGLEANDLATAEAATAVGRVSLAVQSVEVLTSDPLGGTPIDLAWTVGNIGDGDAPGGRIDAIWLSDDAVLDATDTLIAEAATGGGIAAGSVQDLSGTFLLPENVAGPVFLIVETNADDGLPELGSDSDDTRAVEIDVTAAPTPDLGVAGLVAPDLLYGREVSFDLSWAVENTGVAAAPGATWTERVRLLDPDGDVRRELGSFVRTGVPAPGESVERTERITVEGVSGAFLLEVVVDPDDDVF